MNAAPHVFAAVIVISSLFGGQSPVNCENVQPVSASGLRVTSFPFCTSAEQSDPWVPHVMPTPKTVPPVGFMIVSVNMTACGDVTSRSNEAPHCRG